MLKRAVGPGVLFLVGLGVEVRGIQSDWLGFTLLSAAALWALIAVAFPLFVRRVAAEVRVELGLPDRVVETPRETGELRVAVAQLSDELEYAQAVIVNNDERYFEDGNRLPMRWYDNHGTILARSGEMEAHRAMREAYRLIDNINRNSHSGEPVDGVSRTILPDSARAALPAIRTALRRLDDVSLSED